MIMGSLFRIIAQAVNLKEQGFAGAISLTRVPVTISSRLDALLEPRLSIMNFRCNEAFPIIEGNGKPIRVVGVNQASEPKRCASDWYSLGWRSY